MTSKSDAIKAVTASLQYSAARSERRAAHNNFNYASAELELASIKERLAEIESQHEPLASLIDKDMSARNRLVAAAFYVVVGRLKALDIPDKT